MFYCLIDIFVVIKWNGQRWGLTTSVPIDQDTIINRLCNRNILLSPADVNMIPRYTTKTLLGIFCGVKDTRIMSSPYLIL